MYMDLARENQQRNEFCALLLDLAKSQEVLDDASKRSVMYKRLEALYDAPANEKRFRHFYSDIFSVLTQIQQNPEYGSTDVLAQNLDTIRRGYQATNESVDGRGVIDVSDAINKLYDHVNLDVARISYLDSLAHKMSGEAMIEQMKTELNSVWSSVNTMQGIANDFQIKVVEVEKRLDRSQKDYISILGIFASVVLTFSGGIAFSTSVLNNIAQVSIYRIVLISIIIGFVLVNTLFGLFYYVNTIVSKDKTLKPLWISNVILALLLGLTLLAWQLGSVELRNKHIVEEITVRATAPPTLTVTSTTTPDIDVGTQLTGN